MRPCAQLRHARFGQSRYADGVAGKVVVLESTREGAALAGVQSNELATSPPSVGASDPRRSKVAVAEARKHFVSCANQIDRLQGAVGHGDQGSLDKALVVVLNRTDAPLRPREHLDPAVLELVRVLELVDED